MRYVITAMVITLLSSPALGQWHQWGGPDRNFQAAPVELNTDWPESGPPRLWTRELGEGYSAISVEDGVLYTMVRRGEDEVTVALDAATGKTLWEHVMPAPFWDGLRPQHGPGPHATPLVTGERVYTAGIRAVLICLDQVTGKEIWTRDLWEDYDAPPGNRGYASSPIAYGRTVVVPVGGEGQGLVGFDMETGKEVWKGGNFKGSFGSPTLVNLDGEDQLVMFTGGGATGLDPRNGNVLWHHPHDTRYGLNIAMPVWGSDNILFMSAAYDSGSRGIRLSRENGKTSTEELWYDRIVQIHHGTAVRHGEVIYCSIGDFGPAFLTGVHAESGKLLFRQRGFAKTNILAVGNRFILLDEDGKLAIAAPKEDGLDILAEAEVLTHKAWTVPTLVGTTLYLRDRVTIAALDLSP